MTGDINPQCSDIFKLSDLYNLKLYRGFNFFFFAFLFHSLFKFFATCMQITFSRCLVTHAPPFPDPEKISSPIIHKFFKILESDLHKKF